MVLKWFGVFSRSRFSAHAREHASGFRDAFTVPRARGIEIYLNNAHNSLKVF